MIDTLEQSSAVAANGPEPSLAPRSATSRDRRELIRLALIAFGPFVPVTVHFFLNLSKLAHYDFFPIVLAAAAFLVWQRLQGFSTWMPGYSRFGMTSIAIAYVGLIAATLLTSPKIGYLSLLISCVGYLHILGGYPLVRRLAPVGLLLMTLLPPPFDLDHKLILYLQSFATLQASHVLDSLEIAHAVEGNIIALAEKQLFVEEACSGIHSLTSVIIVSIILMIWSERPWWHALIVLASGFIWVLAANTVRIVSIAVAREWYQVELAEGWRHFLLGIGLFSAIMGLVISTDCLVHVFYRQYSLITVPIKPTSAKRSLGVGPAYAITAMVLGGLCFIIGVIPLLPLQTKIDIRDYPLAFGEDLMPQQYKGWSRPAGEAGKARNTTRTTRYDAGDFSTSWRYANGRWSATVSFDYPFQEWHDLTECYSSTGWQILERALHSDAHGAYLIINMKHPERGDARLFYTLIYADGGSPEAPGDSASTWLSSRVKLLDFQREKKVSYQVQMQLNGPKLPDPKMNEEALDLFRYSVKTMREFLKQTKGP